jgi:hypothetical protein
LNYEYSRITIGSERTWSILDQHPLYANKNQHSVCFYGGKVPNAYPKFLVRRICRFHISKLIMNVDRYNGFRVADERSVDSTLYKMRDNLEQVLMLSGEEGMRIKLASG